jgi:hypothetical protein
VAGMPPALAVAGMSPALALETSEVALTDATIVVRNWKASVSFMI